MSTIESRKANWLIASDDLDRPSSGMQPGRHPSLSVRAMLDLAALVTAGAASTVFFLLPVWAPFDRLAIPFAAGSPRVVVLAAGPRIDPTNAALSELATVDALSFAAPQHRRAVARAGRAPAFVRTRPEANPQSKLARLLLGDGRASVRPFPLPERRLQR